jgi:peptidoglycan/xylan/chitin deacetylase (PgdA/CDA1 family)
MQPEAARRNLVLHGHDESRDPRVFLDQAGLRALALHHVIGCHTWNHRRLSVALTAAELDLEIDAAQQRLAAVVQRPIDSFAWVGGEEPAYSSAAAARLRARFRFVFTTNSAPIRAGHCPYQLDRTHLEASFSPALLRFQLSGAMDLRYAAKRRRLRPMLSGAVANAR